MRIVSRVAVVNDGKVLLIRRFRDGTEYYVVPGGGIEEGETPEEAGVREMKEETNLVVSGLRLLWSAPQGYCFMAGSFSGEVIMGRELVENNKDGNAYSLEWVPVNEIKNMVVYPERINEFIS
ncbi:NUDIX domain-containing protein [Candidatus Woesearchaeota archaeon]|nr:NUDIX domain-containing protein [Candidatus Woesearchaeota archaeon]